MKTEGKAFSSMASNVQLRLNEVIDDLQIRKSRGDSDIFDCYERGFIDALKLIDKAYHLDIDFGEEV